MSNKRQRKDKGSEAAAAPATKKSTAPAKKSTAHKLHISHADS